ncbi:hypothetical protein AKJ44_03060 [candidate division MSBL1 archaeon SCGC-AAA261F17]|uniref:PIN domain-containing protein n=1 Tax=candidate division MSBL1 archaeon SCGC-AAA261F17 TaxID=1698274 RepID=A0A133V3H7_9EURY|nr:hypothetical protein AKJ44_03060 [candidate division MSBL1 archaeon SCGC-AAA261F17]
MLEETMTDHEKELSVKSKSGLRVSDGRREIVVCDTNILVYKAFDEIGISPSHSSRKIDSAIKKFGQLASKGNRMLMPKSVEKELKPVCERKLEEEDLDEEEKNRVRDGIKKYTKKYSPEDLPVGTPIEGEEDYLKQVRSFYRSYPDKLSEITQKKINNKPEKKHEILLERGEIFPTRGPTPSEGDIRLLAECIRMNRLPIPRIWHISLLSNDSDFLWFTTEIEREFGIKIHNI